MLMLVKNYIYTVSGRQVFPSKKVHHIIEDETNEYYEHVLNSVVETVNDFNVPCLASMVFPTLFLHRRGDSTNNKL